MEADVVCHKSNVKQLYFSKLRWPVGTNHKHTPKTESQTVTQNPKQYLKTPKQNHKTQTESHGVGRYRQVPPEMEILKE